MVLPFSGHELDIQYKLDMELVEGKASIFILKLLMYY